MGSHLKVTPKKSPWEVIDSLRKKAGLVEDDVPAGAICVVDYASRYYVSRATAARHLDEMVKAGAMKSGSKYVLSGSHRTSVRFYWPT